MIWKNYLKDILLLLGVSVLCFSCSDDEDRIAAIEAKAAKTKTVLANQCKTDDDCLVTGCRGTMCRAMPEPEFCDHRIVISLDNGDDVAAVKRIVAEQLTVQEADTIRIGGYSANRWTLSFHATQAQRERVEMALNAMDLSGFARLHPQASKYTKTAFKELSANDPDVVLRSMKGAGSLVEKKIRSGDILSKDDIRNTWEQLVNLKNVHVSPDDEIERVWAYDVVFDDVAWLRIWPVDKRQRLSVRLWKSTAHRVDNGDIIITAELADSMVGTLKKWTQSGEMVVLMLGNEVVASALPQVTIDDGRFEFVIKDGASRENIVEAVEAFELTANMKGSVHIDDKATAAVERDLTCHQKFPRQCACIDGYCGWRMSADYNACLYE